MPYDRTWARSVFYKYWELHARAQQIDRCLMQLTPTAAGHNLLLNDLHGFLIDSIQNKAYKGLWNQYKALVRRSPLDRKLLYKISTMLSPASSEDPCQLVFYFAESPTT